MDWPLLWGLATQSWTWGSCFAITWKLGRNAESWPVTHTPIYQLESAF